MKIADIHESTEDFHILETTERTQTATISLRKGESTSDGFNSHPHSDQTVLVMEGEFTAEVGEESEVLQPGQSLIIPAGVKHRLSNRGEITAFAVTIYAPPAY
jgi:putative monooxygenase